jgi:Ca-activated chloride channel family protein
MAEGERSFEPELIDELPSAPLGETAAADSSMQDLLVTVDSLGDLAIQLERQASSVAQASEPIAEDFEVAANESGLQNLKSSLPGVGAGNAEAAVSMEAMGYGGSIESSSDDFFLGRGEKDAPGARKKESSRARSREGRVMTDVAKPSPRPRPVKLESRQPQLSRSAASGTSTFTRSPNERPRDMFFRFWGDNPFVVTRNDGLSTFAADVDSASFTLARRMLREGMLPQRAQIRTEEFVNYAKPDLAAPTEDAFAVHAELSPSPFGGREDRWLMRVGVRAKDIAREDRPPLALTFVVDTSGSMQTDNRLELVKHALRLLVAQLDGRDTLSIVGFNSSATEVLPPTPATASDTIETALFGLQPGGGTNAEAGLKLGYAQSLSGGAAPNAQKRVIFLSDGVANIGSTDQDRLAQEVSEYADQGVFLNTIGVGMSNHNDLFLEQLANKGQGVCDYVGDAADARRAIVERFVSGFVTVAKDLKIQVEFDGKTVLRWRQLGYENRAVADRDFRNDAVDAGEIGAGHQVTCFYELELSSGVADADAALAKVRLRWKPVGHPMASSESGTTNPEATETENTFTYANIVTPSFRAASPGFRLGALSAQFAEVLRQSYHSRGDSLDRLSKGLANLLTDAPSKDAGAIAEAFKLAKDLGLKAPPASQPQDIDAAQQTAYYQSLIEDLGGADPAEPQGASPGEDSARAMTPEAYEARIRELLDGDLEKRQH